MASLRSIAPACLVVLLLPLLLGGCGSRTELLAADGGASPPRRDSGRRRDVRPPADLSRPDLTPLDYTERVVRACAVAVSCSTAQAGSSALFSVNACIDSFAGLDFATSGFHDTKSRQLAQRLLDCGARGDADCKAFHACFGGDFVSLDYCHIGSQCEGNALVDSFGPLASSARFDCTSLGAGARCVDLPTGAPRACCGFDPPQTPCQSRCTGGSGDFCLFDVTLPIDCAPSGRRCLVEGSTFCVGDGADCQDGMKTACIDGAIAQYCSGGRLARVDCAQQVLSSACVPGDVYFGPCGAAGQQCKADDVGRCAGTQLIACADGREQRVDCRALGFEICYAALGARPARCGWLL